MLLLVIGGSASGKSAFAEDFAVKLGEKRLYVATMQPFGEEAFARIEKHRKMRRYKGFISVEHYMDLENLNLEAEYDVVMLECMSNLLANEMYGKFMDKRDFSGRISRGIKHLIGNSKNTVIVSNEVFCDEENYTIETLEYIRSLGEINRFIGGMADIIIEVVCGIPIFHKGGEIK